MSSSNGLEKCPKLRFPGFDEPWKETTLSALFSKSTQKNADGHITNVICNSAKLGLIPQREYFDKDIANSDNTSGYYIIRQNDFVYNPRKSSDAPYGPISSYKYAEDGIVSPLYLCFHAKDEINPLYYEWYFRSSAWHRYIYMSGDSGARHDRVSIKDDTFFAMPINLPSEQEQSKIASFLQSLDERIAAQEKLVASLKKYKRGSLSALFPKKREITPQYRFAGFTKPWEQRKLGELPEKTYGGGTPSTTNVEYWNGNIPWLQSSNIAEGKLFDVTPKKFISQSGLNSSAAQLIPENSIAIITRVGVGKLAFLPFSYTTSQDFLSMSRLTTEPYFTVYACYKKLQSELNSVQGTSIKGITKNELLAKEIKVPSYEEQKQIGEYFANLDRLITLHQHKYDTLLSLKNAILQQMFI